MSETIKTLLLQRETILARLAKASVKSFSTARFLAAITLTDELILKLEIENMRKKKLVEIQILNSTDKEQSVTLFKSSANRTAYNFGLPIGVNPMPCAIDREEVTYAEVLALTEANPFVIKIAKSKKMLLSFEQAFPDEIERLVGKKIDSWDGVVIPIPAKKCICFVMDVETLM